jgi:hypothetical protein
MNCSRAQSDIALWAGNDLDESSLSCLRRHLAACPACRGYLAEMQALMQLVDDCPLREEADQASQEAVEDSLWPSLSTRLVALPVPRGDRFNGWLPAVTVAVVCLVMVLVASPPRLQTPDDVHALTATEEAVPGQVQDQAAPITSQRAPRLRIDSMPVGFRPEELPRFEPVNEMFPFLRTRSMPSQTYLGINR